MPIVVQIIKKRVGNKQIRFFTSLILCGVVGTIGALIAGAEFSLGNIAYFTTIAFGMSQMAYNSVKSLIA